MRKPRIPRALKTFVGCAVGEERADYHMQSEFFTQAMEQVDKGNLQTVKFEGRYCSFALTKKGKAIVAEREKYYARF
jgi:hypothetical protein